ncbi:helix-turn-helix domain-containing protein [Roseicella frigidaeris]|uniref:HTH araC/xylS-type domain-containing protein n=1 Tax=Roseicella frigidaeris TaxID=2230885 RepID=A0A327M061_9PROT|nr:AraC family transcriptional regulator [Roseicella frigidaeris]RAI55936.1 hypothetical protein DOO78_23610 [Roseicella frigidaeris]
MPVLLSFVPDAWGPTVRIEGGAVALTRAGPNGIRFTAPAHLVLVMVLPQPCRAAAPNGTQPTTIQAPAGSLELMPADAACFARWIAPKECLLLAFDQDGLAQRAALEGGRGDFEFHPPKLGTIDERARVIAGLIRDEMLQGPRRNEAYLTALLTALKIHLLREHPALVGQGRAPSRGGLPPNTWRRVVEHIQANLSANLSIPRLAEMLGVSPSHFLRAFRQSCGQSPHRYVLEKRLLLVEHLARTTDMPLAQVAEAAGFSSPSHMTAALRRWKGVTPGQLRREARRQDPGGQGDARSGGLP